VSLATGFYLLYSGSHGDFKGTFIQRIFKLIDLYYDRAEYFKNLVQYVLFIFGVLTLLVAIFGLVGAKKKQPCCLFFFNIGTIIFCLLFLAFGIFADVMSQQVLNGGKDCNTIDWSS